MNTPMNLWRQSDVLSVKDLKNVNIVFIGVGGIGAIASIGLAKMGVPHIEVWDYDSVEDHNIPNQFYRRHDIGKLKVIALQEIIRDFTGTEIVYHVKRFNREITSPTIVISAVDSMKSRREIWERMKNNIHVKLYIDSRMAILSGKIFSLRPCDPDHVEWFERKWLPSDEEVDPDPCTAQAIFFNVLVVAGLIGGLVVKYIRNEELSPGLVWEAGPQMLAHLNID